MKYCWKCWLTCGKAFRLPRVPLRTRVEAAIEAAIAWLDLLDGDCDLEPSLARTNPGTGITPGQSSAGVNDDREQDVGDERESEEHYIWGGSEQAA